MAPRCLLGEELHLQARPRQGHPHGAVQACGVFRSRARQRRYRLLGLYANVQAVVSPRAVMQHGPSRQHPGFFDPRDSAEHLRHTEGVSIADPSRHPGHPRDC